MRRLFISNYNPLSKNDYSKVIFLGFIFLVWCASLFEPFFWDTAIYIQHAFWFFEKGFLSWQLSTEIDAGHPPLWGFIIAVFWKIFGVQAYIVRLILLPILLGIGILYFKIAQKFLSKQNVAIALVFFCLDTTILSQFLSINADIPILFLTLLCFWSILNNKPKILFYALPIMCLLNVRAWVSLIILMCYYLYKNRNLKYTFLYFSPGGFTIFLWLLFHYNASGWFLAAPEFISQRKLVSWNQIIINIGLCAWRMIDYGRVCLYIITMVIFSKVFFKYKLLILRNDLILVFLFSTVFFSISFIFFSNPIGHRYFLLPIVLGPIFALKMIDTLLNKFLKRVLILLIACSLIGGSFWIYPPHIAQGWDSTLAHLPYHSLKRNLNDFIYKNKISKSDIFTCFPMSIPELHTDLNLSGPYFRDLELPLRTEVKYILYSNISNDFSDELIAKLNRDGVVIFDDTKGGIFMRLYKMN